MKAIRVGGTSLLYFVKIINIDLKWFEDQKVKFELHQNLDREAEILIWSPGK
jgi:hypothetical protein